MFPLFPGLGRGDFQNTWLRDGTSRAHARSLPSLSPTLISTARRLEARWLHEITAMVVLTLFSAAHNSASGKTILSEPAVTLTAAHRRTARCDGARPLLYKRCSGEAARQVVHRLSEERAA